MNIKEFEILVNDEISRITQRDLVETVKLHKVSPRTENRDWDYGKVGEKYPCWIALEDSGTDTAVVYCEKGFGPSYPWGLVAITAFSNMGMDSGWFASLEEAVRDSMFWHGDNPEEYEVS